MTKDPRGVNEDLVRQEIEQGQKGDRELAKKPGAAPQKSGGEGESTGSWDDDQRKLVDNQDPGSARPGGTRAR